MGETEEHWLLKQVGWALLLRKGCSPIGTEVGLSTWEVMSHHTLPPNEYHITDAAGLIWHTVKNRKEWGAYSNRFRTVYAIEVKVSHSDFKRGFCTRGWGKMWLLTPPGMLKTSELPEGVGLYEYDAEAEKLSLAGKATYSGYQPSETALDDIERSIIWSGYGNSVRRRLEDDDGRLMKLLRPQQTLTLDEEEPPQ